MADGILGHIRIIDLSEGIAGPVAAMLLAECGADVVKVEPPGGTASRGTPGFATWERSKRSIVLDVDDPGDRDHLDGLLADADVLVHSYGPARARALWLDDATLGDEAVRRTVRGSRIRARKVHVQEGPHAAVQDVRNSLLVRSVSSRRVLDGIVKFSVRWAVDALVHDLEVPWRPNAFLSRQATS